MHELDLKGINCPLPILKTKKFLATINSGELVRICTTDISSLKDLQDFCQKTGNQLINQKEEHGVIYTIIKKR